jgi:hypothetical protein
MTIARSRSFGWCERSFGGFMMLSVCTFLPSSCPSIVFFPPPSRNLGSQNDPPGVVFSIVVERK